MKPDEVISFCNHKYGERAYYLENVDEIIIYTEKSIWRILKKDYTRFGLYSLKHLNYKKNDNTYHKQFESTNLNYLVYYCYMHDYEKQSYGIEDFYKFLKSYEMFCYGRELYSSCMTFQFLAED